MNQTDDRMTIGAGGHVDLIDDSPSVMPMGGSLGNTGGDRIIDSSLARNVIKSDPSSPVIDSMRGRALYYRIVGDTEDLLHTLSHNNCFKKTN